MGSEQLIVEKGINHFTTYQSKNICNSDHVNNNGVTNALEFSYTNWGERQRGIHFSVPGENPISRKRDESVSMMSFPGGPRTLLKTR